MNNIPDTNIKEIIKIKLAKLNITKVNTNNHTYLELEGYFSLGVLLCRVTYEIVNKVRLTNSTQSQNLLN